MTLWRRTHSEVAGAWRSLRYDLGRRDSTGTHRRPSHRAAACTAFGALAVAGALGSYFAVVTGIGALTDDEAGGEPYPLAAAAPGATQPELSNEGLGARAAKAAHLPHAPLRAVPATTAPSPEPAATTAPRRTTASAGPAPAASSPEPCDCLTPPVPTPTAAETTESPGPTPSETTAEPSPGPPMPAPTATTPSQQPEATPTRVSHHLRR